MIHAVRSESKVLKGEAELPFSKSESNRVLIIKNLCAFDFNVNHLSDADDTVLLKSLLKNNDEKMDCGAAGTAFRFLTAYLACVPGKEVMLTGSERMKQRPVGPLVDALLEMGADITYTGQVGYPPLIIKGKKLCGGKISINSGVSSQFISALLLIAPVLENGIDMELTGAPVSEPYIDMTLNIMKHFGVQHKKVGRRLIVMPQQYEARDYTVACDWSAASYWYEMAALSQEADIFLKGLRTGTAQGDEIVADIYRGFGVETIQGEKGVFLKKMLNSEVAYTSFAFNCTQCPDLVQTLAVTCAALGIKCELSGVGHLRIKETDRIEALCVEMEKLGIKLNLLKEKLEVNGKISEPNEENCVINTYNDHRMAMAFAPLALLLTQININDPDVVSKSYPQFWGEMKKFFLIQPKTNKSTP